MSASRISLVLGLMVSLASGARAQDFPEATAFANDFISICLDAGADNNAVALRAAERGMKVSVAGRAEDLVMSPAGPAWTVDDDTVLINAKHGMWSCLMVRSDQKRSIPIFAVRKAIDLWPGGITTAWTITRSASPVDNWFTYGRTKGHDFYIRTNRLRGDAVLYLQIEQE